MNSMIDLLRTSKTIAVVGISDNPEKPSYRVAEYMKSKGYKIIPVNPKYSTVLGERCYPDLKSVGEKIDIVDVFRKSEDIPPVAEAAGSLEIKCFWMQLDIKNEEAKQMLEKKGIMVVEDTCIKIFHAANEKELA
jgi:predicted CoA-binding protein